jgi:hypothetical protein
MRFAAIDVGSKSVHLVIADVTAHSWLDVIERVKEMGPARPAFLYRRLSHLRCHVWRCGPCSVRAISRGTACRRSASGRNQRRAGARNRAYFLDRGKQESGIELEVKSGHEEARVIYRAAETRLRA